MEAIAVVDPLVLPERVALDNLVPTRAALLERLPTGRLTIDATALEVVDTAGFQLLCALVATARDRGLEPRWRGVRPHIASAARRLGLCSHLGVDRAER